MRESDFLDSNVSPVNHIGSPQERERDRQTETERQRDRDTDRDTERHRERQRERERARPCNRVPVLSCYIGSVP